MSTLAFVLIVVALAVGAGVTYLFTRSNKTSSSRNTPEEKKHSKLSAQLSDAKREIATLEQQLKALASSSDLSPELREKLLENDSLRKRVKKLQDDVEELEDQLDDVNSRYKQKSEDGKRLSEQVDSLERQLKKIQEELSVATDEILVLKKDVGLKKESLAFVQEILSAQELQNDDEHIQKVNSMYDFVKGELRDTMQMVGAKEQTKNELFGVELEKWTATSKKSWIAGKTSIAFIGEFSAGKTSIVNRILSQDNPDIPLLPVSTKATTAIPTYISGGLKTDFRFFSHDNKLKKISQETFMRVNKEVLDQVGGVSNLIQYFVMEYENSNLDNISILDTPGFSSNDEEDGRRTLEVINECDALFWVFDVNAGTVNRTSLQLIKRHLHKPLYVIINKVDTKDDQDVANVLNLIIKTFSEEGIPLAEGCIITFSKKKPLDELNALIRRIGEQSQRQQTFLLDLAELVQNTCENLANIERQKQSAHESCRNQTSSNVNGLLQTLRQTRSDCEQAERIPQFKKELAIKFWRDDHYEMSMAEFNRLNNILNGISGRMSTIETQSNNIINSSKKEQSALEDLKTSSYNAKRLEEVGRKLNNKINSLNN